MLTSPPPVTSAGQDPTTSTISGTEMLSPPAQSFQRAMLLALFPPAIVKKPPAISSPWYTTSDPTSLFIPLPSGCQATPSQRAIALAAFPPAVAKQPPTISSPL